VLLLTSGRGRSVGWARAEVDEARRLARAGVASLRFDMAGVGDSVPDGPGEPLYDKARTVDVRDAVDALLAVGIGPVALYGRCSGAFLGFAALGAEPRLAGAVLCNGQRYVWRPWETVEQATKQSVRSLGALSERVFEPRQWARLMRREITPRQALTKIVGALLKRGLAFAASRGVALTPEGRLAQGVRAQFGELSRRGTPVRILISDGDRALDELRAILPTQTELERLGNVTLTMAPNADHNMTPRAARAAVGREIDALLETIAARAARG
jgi:pimeloyl-ACP methyl ester carboxylesterase